MRYVSYWLVAVAVGLSHAVLGATSAEATAVPETATILTGKNGTITSTSGSFNSGPAAAFANDGSSRLLKQSTTLNLMYTFAEATVVNCYGIKAGGSYFESARGPKDWTIYGSNDYDASAKNDDSATWTELDSRSEETGWKADDYRFYEFANAKAFTTYKIDITSNNGNNYTQWLYMEYGNIKTGEVKITVNSVTGGSVEGVPASCQAGQDVMLTAVPETGYELLGWRNLTEGTVAFGNPWTFVAKDDVVIEPVFSVIGSNIRYVSPSGDDEGAGTEEAPFATPARALESFGGLGGTIYIAPGEYVLQKEISLTAPCVLCGTGSDPAQTVIKGRATGYSYGVDSRVLSITNPDVVIENLTVARGVLGVGSGNNFGAGVYMTAGVVTNCIIRDSFCKQASTPLPKGGGVYLGGDGALVTHCVITNCSIDANAAWIGACGAGAHIAKGRIENTLFIDCHTAIASPTAENVIGAARLDGGTIVNCSAVRCTGSVCGGFDLSGATATAVNCVAYRCVKSLKNGEGVLETTVSPFAGGAAKFHSCASDAVETYDQNGSVLGLTESAFSDYAGGNFVPLLGGALYDAGAELESYPGVDLAGRNRVMGQRIDIGCYEGLNMQLTIAGSPENYGTATPAYGLHEDISGTTMLTATERVLSEDGLTEISCTGWRLYSVGADGTLTVVDSGTGNTAEITVPSGVSRFEWIFRRRYKMQIIAGGGRGSATCEEWVEEGAEFTPVVTPEDGWNFTGWIGTMGSDASMATTFVANGPMELGATFLPAGVDMPVQYVSTTGDDENDGFTLETARQTVSVAIDEVAKYRERGGKVFIAAGTYQDYVQVSNYAGLPLRYPIEVRGMTGRAEDVVVRHAGWPGRVFVLDDQNAVVSSLTMENGQLSGQSKGVGCLIESNGGTVTNCIVRGCDVSGYASSGAIYVGSGRGFVTHTIVDTCTVGDENAWGGTKAAGIHLAASGARAENCLIRNCRTTTLALNGDKKAMCVGGLLVSGGCSAKNCTVVACKGTRSGGIMASDATAVVRNCAVIDCDYVSEASLEAVNLGEKDWVGTAAAFDHCATDNATAINETCLSGLTAEAFKDYAAGDYTPKSGGPIVDKGVTPDGWATLTDLAGKPRVKGKTVDIGCYEGNPAGLTVVVR